jgi:hypothetical protein
MQEMKYLKTYQLFESKIGLTPDQEAFLNRYTKGTWSYNPATGLVDVEGDFKCHIKHLMDFKGVRFGKVSGSFNCHTNRLTSLEGAPQEVGGNFSCATNNLTSLAGAPQEVGGDFNCENNPLTSLEGAPQKVGEDFVCSWNNLTSLEGAPQEVGWGFYCSYNRLTSLEGAPQEVGGSFSCDAFRLGDGEWNLEGWLKVLKERSQEAQKLILTLLPAEELNKEIAKDPAGMIMKLKKIWNDENFREIKSKLVWPKGYADDADLVGDLDDVGF